MRPGGRDKSVATMRSTTAPRPHCYPRRTAHPAPTAAFACGLTRTWSSTTLRTAPATEASCTRTTATALLAATHLRVRAEAIDSVPYHQTHSPCRGTPHRPT